MKISVLLVVCLFVMAATTATAATVNLTMDNLAANGWKTTTTYVWGGTTNASVTETTHYGTGNFRFFAGTMPVSWEFQWAGLSTDAFAGLPLASITSLRIRNFGLGGDNQNNWQPPTFTFVVDKGDGNQRCIQWMPWKNTNPRAPGMWNEYDAATTGQWLVEETGITYNSLAELKAALPNAFFELAKNLPLDYGYASNHAFNVGLCPLYDEDRARYSGVTGYIDWFEVGVNNEVTRYDLGLVPEPSSLVALSTGLLGLFGIMRRRK